ncbi:diaminohydroxyphosphoribosylaminopyrimidine deaminase/5-amino-6-(5-phosphoribosylamino)uracil reductase [Clostridiales Family XIII bacterium PM5-7]
MQRKYMELAISLAKKAIGFTNPNPLVGAVIVKHNRIIGTGYHQEYGGPHAERNALASCTESPEGATMYVTLTPCCHYGKTPPCTDAIIQYKLAKVVIGSRDPNPLVLNHSITLLEAAGITVVQDVMKTECDALNAAFFHYITTGLPYVTMKYAMTLDGKIATHSGASKWITGHDARANVHRDRHQYAAIMVGSGTVIRDNPQLTARFSGSKDPVRIICDTALRIPLDVAVVKTAKNTPTIIATACEDKDKQRTYTDLGCRIIWIPKDNSNHIDLVKLMEVLGKEQINSILLEGGGQLNWSALCSGIVNKVQAYIAPKLFGGNLAPGPIGGIGVDTPNQAFALVNQTISHFGDDLLIESEVKSCLPES